MSEPPDGKRPTSCARHAVSPARLTSGGSHVRPKPEDIARSLLKIRRRREAVFGSAFFSEPSWDMLLDLLVAEGDKRTVSLSNLCMEAMVPVATGSRWAYALEAAGLIHIRRHTLDRRTRIVTLSPETSLRLRQLMGEL